MVIIEMFNFVILKAALLNILSGKFNGSVVTP